MTDLRARTAPASAIAWEPVIGLEIHVQLKTRTKMFCGCELSFGDPPNVHTCPVCLGHPGALPALNGEAVRLAIAIGLALGCEVAPRSEFHRKNYFYPDLPKAYQISQYDEPLCVDGHFLALGEAGDIPVGITRVHLEEDAAKLLHLGGDGRRAGAERSAVDFNRGGTPLVEVVTEPDLRSAADAVTFLKQLRQTLLHLGVSDGNMEEGSLRADANVSVRPAGTGELGTKAELKNMNSFRFLERGITAEIARQIAIVESGGRVVQETLHFDPDTGDIHPLRSKEEAHDYRYFPEPDLVPLAPAPEWVEEIRAGLPELPVDRRRRWMSELGLSYEDAEVLSESPELADYFERTAALVDPKASANWIRNELRAQLRERGEEPWESRVTPERMAAVIGLLERREINVPAAKEVLAEVIASGADPEAGVGQRGGGPGGAPGPGGGGGGGGAGPARRRRPAGPGRAGGGREPGTGPAAPRGQGQGRRLLRGSGDEGERRPGRPGGGARPGARGDPGRRDLLTDDLLTRSRRVVAETFGFATTIEAVRAEGAWVEARDGRRYLDCASGTACTNLGHNHPRVMAAAREQMERMVHSGGIFRYESMVALAERLAEVTPGPIGSFFFLNGGGEAVEGAVKMARHTTGRHGVVAFRGGFHGRTLGATSYTTSKAFYRARYAPMVGGVHVTPFPTPLRWGVGAEEAADLALRALDELHRHDLPPEETACYLVEPVQGEGGYLPAGRRFLEGLRERADRSGALLVVDEVQTGFGRCGDWFASQVYGVEPDVIALAKGIANGFPVSAIGGDPERMARWPPGSHGSTFGGNPVACAAGCATIDTLGEERLPERARVLGERATARLRALAERVPEVAEVRGPGLMIGVELADPASGAPRPDLVSAAVAGAEREGVIVIDCGPENSAIRFIPPLTISDDDLDAALTGLERGVEGAAAGAA